MSLRISLVEGEGLNSVKSEVESLERDEIWWEVDEIDEERENSASDTEFPSPEANTLPAIRWFIAVEDEDKSMLSKESGSSVSISNLEQIRRKGKFST